MAFHRAKRRKKQAPAGVTVFLAGREDWFLAYYAFAFHNFGIVQGILDFPAAGSELNRVFTLVFNGNGIGKGILHFTVFVKRAVKFGLYRNLDSLCYLLYHFQ